MQLRPRSAPAHRLISEMDNEEPLFRKTVDDKGRRAVELNCLNPHQVTIKAGLLGMRLRSTRLRVTKWALVFPELRNPIRKLCVACPCISS